MTRHDSAVKATLAGMLDTLHRRPTIGRLPDDLRIDGRTCLVTGASSGLGKAVATGLARMGGHVIMAVRRPSTGARRDVIRESGNRDVIEQRVDLADLGSVRAFCDRIVEAGHRIDVMVLNAAVVPRSSRPTVDGFDEMFQVNYLSTFLLVGRLVPAVMHRPGKPPGPRVVFVSSEAHRSSPPVDPGTLGAPRHYSISGVMKEYNRNKLLLTTFAMELSRRLEPDVAVHAICPGAVNSNIAREAPAWSKPVLRAAFSVAFRSPERAARPVLYLCCSPDIEHRTGVYLHVQTEKDPSADALDPARARALWEATERLLHPPEDDTNPTLTGTS